NPQEMRAIFHALLTTVYLHPDYPGYVVGIEPKPFLQELMDVSVLPNWKPPDSGGDGGGIFVFPHVFYSKIARNSLEN
ncbi:MAG: hypothetical protein EA396_12265, partial [Anaerolineaceae bacterium]